MFIRELFETDFGELDPIVLRKVQSIPNERKHKDAISHHYDNPDFDWRRSTAVEPDNDADNPNYEFRGQGIDGKVVKDKNLPKVIKAQRGGTASAQDNPYMAYILMSRKYQDENPFFPRIYDIKQRRGRLGDVEDYLIDMEELVPLGHAPPGALKFIAKQLFGKELSGTYTYILAEKLATMVRRAYVLQNVKDKNLRNAFNLIRLINKKRNLDYDAVDLHPGNMMIRTNVSGPQLVITDPLA